MDFFLVAEHLVTNKQYDLISSLWFAVPLIVDYQICTALSIQFVCLFPTSMNL